jgi:hypothetical protein
VKYRILGHLLQMAAGCIQTNLYTQIIQPREQIQQSQPMFPLLVFHAVETAFAGPAKVTEGLLKVVPPLTEVLAYFIDLTLIVAQFK